MILIKIDIRCLLRKLITNREHPFNLKGGGGYVFFSESKYFFGLRSAAEFFFHNNLQHYFFSTKTTFLRHKVLTEFFFLPISETEFFFQSNLPTKNFPLKNYSPLLLPPFKLNGCSLRTFSKLDCYR